MARQPGLMKSEPVITLSQRLQAAAWVRGWRQKDSFPIEAAKAGVYAAALAAAPQGSDTVVLARCLLCCQTEVQQFTAEYLPWYLIAFHAFPGDPIVVFYLAALCFQGSIQNPDAVAEVYTALLRPEWFTHPLWAVYALNKKSVIHDLANLYAASRDIFTVERVTVVEAALERASGNARNGLIAYLAAAYRAGSTAECLEEDRTVEIYREAFEIDPDDHENCRHLAGLLRERGAVDELACTVYGRMASLCEMEAGGEAADWVVHLAHTYIRLARFDEGTFHTLKEAALLAPEDAEIAAALAYVTALHQSAMPDSDLLDLLADALRREEEFLPVFNAHGWKWSVVLRALSAGWGRAKRADRLSRVVYSRAIILFPDEKEHILYLAHALAISQNYGTDAIESYREALRITPDDDRLLIALGRTFVAVRAESGELRGEALKVWERLYRQKMGWSEMNRALAHAYLGEERVSDTALALWGQRIVLEPENSELRIRIGRESKARGDMEGALRWFGEGLALAPQGFEANFEMGLMLAEYKMEYAPACDLLCKAIVTPVGANHLRAHAALGEALLAMDRRDEARRIFQTIIDRIDANHAPSLMHLAKLNLRYETAGIAQAEALIEQALTLAPGDPQAYARLAELYREKGQTGAEEEALEKYVALAPADPAKYRQLADLYLRRGEYTKAETALRQVIALGEGDKKLYTLLGEVMLGSGSRAA